jgi:hypothetical protein
MHGIRLSGLLFLAVSIRSLRRKILTFASLSISPNLMTDVLAAIARQAVALLCAPSDAVAVGMMSWACTEQGSQ